tara:strand:- start:97 stop:1269 length:1173 start_codon:yes stop_codon:yes gene_type:complete
MTSIETLKKQQQDLEGRIQRLEKQKLDLDDPETKQSSFGDDELNLVHSVYKKEMVKIDSETIQDFPQGRGIGAKKILKGHYGKVYSLHWAGDSRRLVSASQDGKLIVWDGVTKNKLYCIRLRSPWVMTCAFDQTDPKSRNVACGGLDNVCSIYIFKDGEPEWEGAPTNASVELAGHDGYLSCCRFVDSNTILTSSGDQTCVLWNYAQSSPKAICKFTKHKSDVMCVSVNPKDPNMFVAGDCDSMAMVWDVRCPQRPTHIFKGHESDINFVDFFQDGRTFATGSDDSSCRLWDIRSYRELRKFQDVPKDEVPIMCGVTSVSASKSGRILFAAYDDWWCRAWDTLGDESGFFKLQDPVKPYTHENRVACVSVAPDGNCVATGGWDTLLKLWA